MWPAARLAAEASGPENQAATITAEIIRLGVLLAAIERAAEVATVFFGTQLRRRERNSHE
jgi:hypothetical protein